jgi:sodium/proline symporter
VYILGSKKRTYMDMQILLAFGLYFIVLLIIALYTHGKSVSESDFIMGNRKLNFWVTSLSAHAADMSAWLFMAFPAAVFLGGVSQLWIAFGLLIGMFCNWQFVAPKLRVATEKNHSYTLSTFFERTFVDDTGIIRVVTASMSLIFFTWYLSAGLIAMGNLFDALFGIDYYVSITISTLVVVIYTFIGGFVTVAWMDLFRGLFLLAVIMMVPIVAFMYIDGFTAISTAAYAKGISFNLFNDSSLLGITSSIFLALGWGLGYFGQPHILTKFMGIKNAADLPKSKYLGISWQFLALSSAAAVGFVGIAFFPEGLRNNELVFVDMVRALFNPFTTGLILCGILAANMSAMDSQILVCASVLTEDIFRKIFPKMATPKGLLLLSRIGVVLVAIVSLIFAFSKSATVADTVFYAWSGLGCSFGPLVLTALYSNRVNKYGAIAGIIVGGVIAAFWLQINPLLTDFPIPTMIPGFFLSIGAILFVSSLTSKRSLAKAD